MSTADLFSGSAANPLNGRDVAARAATLREELHRHGHQYYVLDLSLIHI